MYDLCSKFFVISFFEKKEQNNYFDEQERSTNVRVG